MLYISLALCFPPRVSTQFLPLLLSLHGPRVTFREKLRGLCFAGSCSRQIAAFPFCPPCRGRNEIMQGAAEEDRVYGHEHFVQYNGLLPYCSFPLIISGSLLHSQEAFQLKWKMENDICILEGTLGAKSFSLVALQALDLNTCQTVVL